MQLISRNVGVQTTLFAICSSLIKSKRIKAAWDNIR
ncbi:MAG: hypothetical protein JWQ21_2674 [Herminiimonas sp.]|nr:hypothetical protein [Herminiimonas sp.]